MTAIRSKPWSVLDLTHTITAGMPVYPGTEPPILQPANTIAKDGFAEKKITFYSHTGTHMDAPAHILPGATTLDLFPAAQFWGSGIVVDVSRLGKKQVDLDDLLPLESQIQEKEFVLIYSGWSEKWESEAYFRNYPVLSLAAAEWLVKFPIKGIGVDMISVDPVEGNVLPIHHIILGANKVIIENLTGLAALVGFNFHFACWPLKLETADGSPVRAVAVRI